MATQEIISLGSWLAIGKKHEHIVLCSFCGETHKVISVEDIYHCYKCDGDIRTNPSKAHRFVSHKENLIPVFAWSDPVKTIRKKYKPKKTRKTFDG